MVKSILTRRVILCCLLITLSSGLLYVAGAQSLVYHLEHEWVKIWINQDGTIDLLYDIRISCDQGDLGWVEIGQPNGDFQIGEASDEYNNTLSASDASQQNDYKVRVYLNQRINAGESVRFTVLTNVGQMIWEDTTNPGNVGMQFIPSWVPVTIENLRLQIVTPKGVSNDNLKTIPGIEWDNATYEQDRFAVYWERSNLAPNQKYTFGVSFPQEFVDHYEVQPTFWQTFGPWILVLAVVSAVIGIMAVAFRKKPYRQPVVKMEVLGVKRGLTAVEASCLLELEPKMIVTAILYGLLKKRVVWVTSTDPAVTLEILAPYKGKSRVKLRTPRADKSAHMQLRYYEIDLLDALKADGTLDEEKLARTIQFLGYTVEEKLRGYCRRDTVNYYRKVVEKAWNQVDQAGTSKLASEAYNEQLLWLLLDPEYNIKTRERFATRSFEPTPFWFWYWYGYKHYYPNPTYKPNTTTPTAAGKPPIIPGVEFANNIATAVETTSANIVANLAKFADSLVSTLSPARQPRTTSHKPAHHRVSCVCACAACACACACVSCACACAGGGAG
jgi:hypothetical protein